VFVHAGAPGPVIVHALTTTDYSSWALINLKKSLLKSSAELNILPSGGPYPFFYNYFI